MKKRIASVLVLTIVVLCLIPVYSSAANMPTKKVYKNAEFGYSYTEVRAKNGCVTSTYVKPADYNRSTDVSSFVINNNYSDDFEATKDLLKNLGMDEDYISDMTSEELQKYANSNSIISTTAYVEIGEDGESTIISQDEAINAATPMVVLPPSMEDIGGDGGEYRYVYEYENTTGYARMNYVVSDVAGGLFKFSLGVTWLSMPSQKYHDLLGISSVHMTVEDSTRSGWIQYKRSTDTESTKRYVGSSNFVNRIDGNWYGSAMVVDYSAQNLTGTYELLKFHYGFEGNVLYPELTTNFNTIASFEHTTLGVYVDSSVSISSDGTIGLSLTPELVEYVWKMTLSPPSSITYEP